MIRKSTDCHSSNNAAQQELEDFPLYNNSFYYAENVLLNPLENRLYYQPKNQSSHVEINNPHFCKVRSTNEPIVMSNSVVYDRVAIIPYRHVFNIFHYMEGTNTLVHVLRLFNYSLPVLFSFILINRSITFTCFTTENTILSLGGEETIYFQFSLVFRGLSVRECWKEQN